jgi:hypothetical protein
MNSKQGIKTPFEKLHDIEEKIDQKLTSLPNELDEFLFKDL